MTGISERGQGVPEEMRERRFPKERMVRALMSSSAFKDAAAQAMLKPATVNTALEDSQDPSPNHFASVHPFLLFSIDNAPYRYWASVSSYDSRVMEISVSELYPKVEREDDEEDEGFVKDEIEFGRFGGKYKVWDDEKRLLLSYESKPKIAGFLDRLEQRIEADEARRAKQ